MTTLSDFLGAFFPQADETIHLRFFKPKGVPSGPDNLPLKRATTRAALSGDTHTEQIIRELNRTRGVYFVVNYGGNLDSEIKRCNAFFAECDDLSIGEQHAALDRCPLPPSIRVETRKSVHAYWLTEGECSTAAWRDVQVRLIAYFSGDETIKNPSRVMRLPFFDHLHFTSENGHIEREEVEVVAFHPEWRYTLAEMQTAFPAPPPKAAPSLTTTNETNSYSPDGLFATWDDLTAELKRRIMAGGKLNARGIFDARGVCHNGQGDTALMFNPATGAVHCNKGCDFKIILRAFGLPEGPTAQANSGAAVAPEDFAFSWGSLESRGFSLPEFILFETARGEVAQLTSATNIGKTTLLLNTALSLTCGRNFPPLVDNSCKPRKVLFLDFETRLSRLKYDISRMAERFNETERDDVRRNLFIVCDSHVENEPLSLSNPLHLRIVELQAKELGVDLIIIDTAAGAFNLHNENDNAEVSRALQKPLRQLAAVTDATVIYSHHIGKAGEQGAAREARAYRGRGASAYGCFARSVFNLEPDAKDRDRVTLACAKSKGSTFNDVVLRLDREARWFVMTDEAPPRIKTNYELVIDAIKEADKAVTRKEIKEILGGRVADSSIGRSLDEGVLRGDLIKPKHGLYVLATNTQILTPISSEHLSISQGLQGR